MIDPEFPVPGRPAWLGDFLDEAARNDYCTRPFCTTCGGTQFRTELFENAAAALGLPRNVGVTEQLLAELVRQLAILEPDPAREDVWLEPVHLIFCEIWRRGRLNQRDCAMRLQGTWAGRVLSRMQDHAARRSAARRAHDEFNSPAAIQARREEKYRLRQEAHADRIARKRERDRLRLEQHLKDEAGDPGRQSDTGSIDTSGQE